MTGKQNAVLWMGLLLVGVMGFTSGLFRDLWATVSQAGYAGLSPAQSIPTLASTPVGTAGSGGRTQTASNTPTPSTIISV